MNAIDVLAQAEAQGISVGADGADLVLRYDAELPEDLVRGLRRHKAEVMAFLCAPDDRDNDPVACRGCAAVIPVGTTLCIECGSKRSPLVRYALELSALAEERTLRGLTLTALDRRRYPRLRLPDGRSVGPGLIGWCPTLRDADAETLRSILRLTGRTNSRAEEEDQE